VRDERGRGAVSIRSVCFLEFPPSSSSAYFLRPPSLPPQSSWGEGRGRVFNSAFINTVLNFLGLGLSLYIVARIYGAVTDDAIIKPTVKCKYCRKRISEKVCWPRFFFFFSDGGVSWLLFFFYRWGVDGRGEYRADFGGGIGETVC